MKMIEHKYHLISEKAFQSHIYVITREGGILKVRFKMEFVVNSGLKRLLKQ